MKLKEKYLIWFRFLINNIFIGCFFIEKKCSIFSLLFLKLFFMVEFLYNFWFNNLLFLQSNLYFFWFDFFYDGHISTKLSIILIFIALILIDFLYYIFWILFWWIPYLDRLIYNNKNLFYIYFRFIPILWNFWTFIWAFLSSEINFKEDLKKIFLGNLFFIIFWIIFWKIFLSYFY